MKRLIGAGLIALFASTAVAAKNNNVYVEYNGEKERFMKLDFDTLSVCSFKQQVADQFGLNMRKFDLLRGSSVLNESRTMDGAFVINSTTLTVREKSNSTQCT